MKKSDMHRSWDCGEMPSTGKDQTVTRPNMFYASGISSLDLGTTPEARQSNQALPVVLSGDAGGKRLGYIITMVGHVE